MRIEISNRHIQRGLVIAVVTGTAVAFASFGGLPYPPEETKPISASDMRANLKAVSDYAAGLEQRIKALEDRAEAATYLGASTPSNVDDIGGYGGAAAKCTSQFQTPAHMCTARDLIIAQSHGQTLDKSGWYASGLRIDAYRTSQVTVNDCYGFTRGESGVEGPMWTAAVSDNKWQTNSCNAFQPFLCCAD